MLASSAFDLGFAPSLEFGQHDPRLADLQKALGQDYTRQNQTDGSALVFEDLRNTLISTTYSTKDMRLV